MSYLERSASGAMTLRVKVICLYSLSCRSRLPMTEKMFRAASSEVFPIFQDRDQHIQDLGLNEGFSEFISQTCQVALSESGLSG
jgi:hypothetical protein